MVDVGGRDSDGLGKGGYKIKIVLDSGKKLLIPGNLIHCTLVWGNIPETVNTYLL